MENVEPMRPRKRQMRATGTFKKSKRLWLQFGASEASLARRFPRFNKFGAILASPGNAKILENVMPLAPKKNLCLAMNGKRAEINNISKHVVICSSRLFVLLYFSFYCCSIASPRSAWHCMLAPRALRSLRSLARFARPPSWTVLGAPWPPKTLPR